MQTKNILLGILIFGASLSASAQQECCTTARESGWCWGADPGKTKETNVLFTDYINSQKYEEAKASHEWLTANVPCLHLSLYQNGATMYQELAKKAKAAKDEANEILYQDKALEQYDLRIKYFGEEASVLNRKGFYTFSYLVNRKTDAKQQIYDEYKKIYDLNGNTTTKGNLETYMLIACMQTKAKKLTEQEIMSLHETLSKTVATNVATDKAKWGATQEFLDTELTKVITINCDFVKKFFVPKMTTDLAFAKKTFQFMLKDKCTKEPEFLQAAKIIYEAEPTASYARIIGQQAEGAGNDEEAIAWYEKSIPLEADVTKKGDTYMDIAKMVKKQGKLGEARAYANKAVEANSAIASDAYTFIGNMYFSSMNSCTGDDPVKARAVYMIAHDMYAKAGNGAGMSRCKEQFPSVEDIFTHKYKEGESISVGCWIGGSTIIRRR